MRVLGLYEKEVRKWVVIDLVFKADRSGQRGSGARWGAGADVSFWKLEIHRRLKQPGIP